MQMIGCDLHARQQTLAILDTETGVLEERVLEHAGNTVRDSTAPLKNLCAWASKPPVRCTGSFS